VIDNIFQYYTALGEEKKRTGAPYKKDQNEHVSNLSLRELVVTN